MCRVRISSAIRHMISVFGASKPMRKDFAADRRSPSLGRITEVLSDVWAAPRKWPNSCTRTSSRSGSLTCPGDSRMRMCEASAPCVPPRCISPRNPFIVGRETDGQPRGERPHFLGELHERLVERADGGVRGPGAHLDDFEPHAAMVLEDVGGFGQALADPLFPSGLDAGVGGIDQDRHRDLVDPSAGWRLWPGRPGGSPAGGWQAGGAAALPYRPPPAT